MTTAQRNIVKAFLLESGLYREVNQAHKRAFNGDTSQLEALRDVLGFDTVKIAIGLNKSFYQRKNRVRGKVEGLFQSGEVRFLTLTFRDDVLNDTSHATRRKYVARYLKSQSPIYVANVDYGKTTEREHYHALVVGEVDFAPWLEKCGFISANKIRHPKKDIEAVCKYVAKLTNHAIKKTANKGERLIYSRSLKVNFEEIF